MQVALVRGEGEPRVAETLVVGEAHRHTKVEEDLPNGEGGHRMLKAHVAVYVSHRRGLAVAVHVDVDVARVRVGVEEPVNEQLLRIDAHDGAHQRVAVHLCHIREVLTTRRLWKVIPLARNAHLMRGERRLISDLEPVDVVHHEHAARREAWRRHDRVDLSGIHVGANLPYKERGMPAGDESKDDDDDDDNDNDDGGGDDDGGGGGDDAPPRGWSPRCGSRAP